MSLYLRPYVIYYCYDAEGILIYCGGPVWSVSWCHSTEEEQYLAVSTHPSMSSTYQLASTSEHPNLLQVWSLGHISNKSVIESSLKRRVYLKIEF